MIASGGIYIAYAFGWWKMASGGVGLESLMRSSWETVIAVGLSAGLIVAFREVFDRSSRLLEAMVVASFGAYILHPAIIVGLQIVMTGIPLVAFAKFTVVSLLGTVAAFVIADLAGRVPGFRPLLGATSGREASS